MHRPVADGLSSIVGSSSTVQSGATLTFYSLADVLQEVYTDTDWLTPASTSGVLTADASGRFPKAFFKSDLDYKAVLKDSSGTTLATINPIFKASNYLTSSSLTPYLLKAGGTMTGALFFAEGAAITSAATINLDAATGNMVHITGATGISAITLAQGAQMWVVFDDALTLTDGASLILLGDANITTVAGDIALFVGEGSGVTRMLAYHCVDGKQLVESYELYIAASDLTTNLTTGTAKASIIAPCTFYITSSSLPRASVATAQTAGSILAFDVNKAGASIFSTVLTIDNNETLSDTAATPCVLSASPTTFTDGDLITVDIDTVGTAGAKGAAITLRGYRRNRS